MPDFLNIVDLSSFSSAQLTNSLGDPKQLFIMLGALAIFLYGMSIGKTRALLSLLSIFVALTLTNMFPYLEEVMLQVPDSFEPYLAQVGIFFALYIAVFMILHQSSLRRLSMGELSIGKVFLISLIQVGFIGAVVTSFIPRDIAMEKLKFLYTVFAAPLSLFLWSLIALGVLPFMKHRRD